VIELVTQRPRARLDLLEQFVYFGETANVELAERYFAAVAETCARLAVQPKTGTPYDCGIERLAGLRRVPVKGFQNYLSLLHASHGRHHAACRTRHPQHFRRRGKLRHAAPWRR